MIKKELIQHLKNQGFSEKIVGAFQKINRKDFIPKQYFSHAYEDIALPINPGQTISQPYTIAFMLELLELKDNISLLEVGSGSGYVLALINEMSKNSKLYGIERIKKLANKSKKALIKKGNITITYKDGTKGFSEKAPFDKILVSAAFDEIPYKLIKQLKIGGILVTPVRNSIYKIKRSHRINEIENFLGFVFVPILKNLE